MTHGLVPAREKWPLCNIFSTGANARKESIAEPLALPIGGGSNGGGLHLLRDQGDRRVCRRCQPQFPDPGVHLFGLCAARHHRGQRNEISPYRSSVGAADHRRERDLLGPAGALSLWGVL